MQKTNTMTVAKSFFNIAQSDLKASKILYEKKLYCQSVFYFQQSVEKANKAYARINNIITEEELIKSRDHKTNIIYKKIIDNYILKIDEYKNVSEDIPLLKELKYHTKIIKSSDKNENDKLKKIIDNFQNELVISSYNINYIIKIISEFKTRKVQFSYKTLCLINSKRHEVINEFNKVFKTEEYLKLKNEINIITSDEKQNIEFIKKLLFINNNLLKNTKIYYTLFFMSLLSTPHAKYSRYPYAESKIFPKELYTKRLPLVKKLPLLINLMQDTLKLMPIIYNELK